MGDRYQVIIRSAGDAPLYFYTHWNATRMPHAVQQSLLRAKDRWEDSPYLARIIFCDMIQGEERATTGYGISTLPYDVSYEDLVIDPEQCTVTCKDKRYTFEEYIYLRQAELDALVIPL